MRLIKDEGVQSSVKGVGTEEKMKLRAIFASSPDAITVTDLNGNIIECNQAALDMHGYSSKDEVIGKSAFAFIAKKDHQRAMENLRKTMERGSVRNIEYTFLTKDDHEFPAELSASVIKDSSGNPTGFVAVTKDITERKRMEEELRKSEEKYRTLYETIRDGIAGGPMDGCVAECNQAFADMLGYSKDELENLTYQQLTPKRWHQTEAKIVEEQILKRGYSDEYEKEYIRKDGTVFPISAKVWLVRDENGKPKGMWGIVRDITERKKAEKALRRSEEQARHLLEFQSKVIDTADVWVNLIDAEGNVTLWNRAAELISGYSREEVIGHLDWEWEWLYPDPKYRAKVFAETKKIIEKGEPIENDETTITCKDGTLKTISWYCNNILDLKGKPAGLISVGIDVTEIKKAQQKVRESEEKYRDLFENARDVIVTFDLKGNVTSINKAVAEYGFKEEEVVGKNMLKFVSKKYWPRLLIELVKIARGNSVEGEIEIITPKGKGIAEYRSNPMRRGKKVVGFQTILRDITERKQMEEKLRQYSERLEELVRKRTEELLESEKKYSVLVEEASDGVAILQDAKIVFANKRGAQIFGYTRDEVFGLPFEKLVDEKHRQLVKERYERRLRGETVPATYEIALIAKTGERVPVELSATRINYQGRPADLVIARDIRERRRLEEERLKLERLAAIGEAAAMVGHDLRNPLQAVVNTLYLAKEKLGSMTSPERQGVKELLKTLEEQVGYMNKIVSDLQDYAGPVRPEPVPTSLPQLINEVLSTLTVPETIKVSKVISEDFPELMVDPALMRRLFTNLIINALQAMPDGGQLTIRSSKTGETAFISVQDTGVGIPREDLPKLFQPLFTTKSKGQGFGLAVCKRLVEAHGGNVTVESEVGRGSTFTVNIPLRREVS